MHPLLKQLLDALPDPDATDAWADSLDALQQQLRECLATEMMTRVIALALPGLSVSELGKLQEILVYTATLAFIAEKDLRAHYYGRS